MSFDFLGEPNPFNDNPTVIDGTRRRSPDPEVSGGIAPPSELNIIDATALPVTIDNHYTAADGSVFPFYPHKNLPPVDQPAVGFSQPTDDPYYTKNKGMEFTPGQIPDTSDTLHPLGRRGVQGAGLDLPLTQYELEEYNRRREILTDRVLEIIENASLGQNLSTLVLEGQFEDSIYEIIYRHSEKKGTWLAKIRQSSNDSYGNSSRISYNVFSQDSIPPSIKKPGQNIPPDILPVLLDMMDATHFEITREES